MIIVYLKGGLGNQMFQYALGRHLACIHNTELKLDISAYNYDGPLEYALEPFNTIQNFAAEDEVKCLTEAKQNKLQKYLHGMFHNHPKRPGTFIRWNSSTFNRKILQLPDNVYLEGYWQSEKYFRDIEETIRREFTIKQPQAGKDKELADSISSTRSVSLHIRRGDYVSDQKTNVKHGTIGLDYYHECVEHLISIVKEPHFFVFSDDPEWCRDSLKLPYAVTYVDHNGLDKAHEDLRLMSQCRHNIVANSSFSWWGAWLNKNSEKIVLAPKKWFAKSSHSIDDIIPMQWIKK